LVIVILTVMQTRQPVFIKLLQSTYRIILCPWLSGQQKFHVENCLRTLVDIGELFSFQHEFTVEVFNVYCFIYLLLQCSLSSYLINEHDDDDDDDDDEA